MASLDAIVEFLDRELRTAEVPDYSGALNGLQLQNDGTVTHVGAAVDCSARAVRLAAERGVDLLLVHHGMFWGGAVPLVGPARDRVKTAVDRNIAIYSSHIPLDLHPRWGNNVLLAKWLGLTPSGGFAMMRGVAVGVSGTADMETSVLRDRAAAFAQRFGGVAVCTPLRPGQKTHRWAMCTGAGASPETLKEAADGGFDTLIVGEGPHHSAVHAIDHGLTIMYLGHYATETLGVVALATELADKFGLKSSFIEAPTGL